jgi:peptidoglycan/LPS O-acetylase OafA/YrhL
VRGKHLIMTTQLSDKPLSSEPPDDGFKVSARWWDRIANIYETESGASRIVPMEGVRGWAVLLVFFVHFHGAFHGYLSPGSTLFRVSDFLGEVGNTGVDLFFVVSGYLIYGAVVRPRFNYARFMRRRVQRLYPTFLGVFLMYMALWAFSHDDNFKFHGTLAQQAGYIAENLLLMPGIFRLRAMNTVTWSLSYEMFFYLFLPLLLAVTGLRRFSRRGRIFFFLAPLIAGLLISPLLSNPRVRLVGFLFGIILFELVEEFRDRASNVKNFMVLGAYGCALAAIYFIERTNAIPDRFVATLVAVTAGGASFGFCGFGFHGGGFLSRVLSWPPLRWLGNMSYSYYLIHPLAIGVVRQSARRLVGPGEHPLVFVALVLAALATSWGAASLLFMAVEKPLSIQVSRKVTGALLPVVAAH